MSGVRFLLTCSTAELPKSLHFSVVQSIYEPHPLRDGRFGVGFRPQHQKKGTFTLGGLEYGKQSKWLTKAPPACWVCPSREAGWWGT